MALNSPTFLFLFLPVFLILYFVSPFRIRNYLLLLFSLFFFLWSDPIYAPFIFGLVLINFFIMKTMKSASLGSRKRSRLLVFGVIVDLVCLILFKVFIAWWQSLPDLAAVSELNIPVRIISILPRAAHFPLGLSFFTLQAVSMLIDASSQKDADLPQLLSAANYLLMFPKAISGPIERFQKVAMQIRKRNADLAQTSAGIRRFMLGFAKKALIADQLALLTSREIFSQSPLRLPAGLAWLGLLCYTLQIYFDFSAYTDMAVGLGQALGFNFSENFNFPYLSRSITEFWRRWHISLSQWFRDYVFYPLELKRRSSAWLKQPMNILIVFFLTGLWHGITLPFIVWGLIQGAALILESGRFGKWLKKLWLPLQHGYALAVIMLGWVIFRSPDLAYAWNYLKALGGFSKPAAILTFSAYPPVSPLVWCALAAGILFSFPVLPALQKCFSQVCSTEKEGIFSWTQTVIVFGLFIAGIIVQAGTTYLPFIYGEF
jgi:alginate O-acetyltransferase complex protein AlgI